ncbi:fused MFS/spermidine synthase [Brevundimonas sp. AJA228-03]|uniref:spermidine synthase n=1 Tax=Brevundimonas sp. AJA228-03 TaxID=2752515 RepID=UPI001ADFF02A|nr:fused MFS/spermidine synthase [Brevundimonas sp. AJA228-03]QTN18264.1 fused MFS/spermidine synthase [Brevundimonas sp. AJA228-03]
MTDTALPDDAAPSTEGGDRVTPVLFAVAIFTSAALVFVVQPMVTKLVLPMLGGSPSVWNTAMVFFQTALLAGYCYAHLLQRLTSMRAQMATHLVLLLLAALFLPLKINGVLGDPDPSAPIGWLLATLALSVGAPFAVLSATAPLLQAWYARVRVGHADGKNPYVLYAASNLGSFLALLAYPLILEPLMTLSGQRVSWSGGYAAFMLMVVALAVVAWQRGQIGGAPVASLETSAPIPWREKFILVLLAAAPSSLMLGVTAHLATDVASAPFLWVIPLALYLLTFVIAFQDRPWIPLPITLVISGAVTLVCISFTAFRTGDWIMMFGLHLATFFLLALMCHQRLAARRPPPDRLTEFYLLMSLGGVVGGAFTALLAPVLFNGVWEYPLVLVLAGLARPFNKAPIRNWEVYLFVGAVLATGLPPLLSAAAQADWGFGWWLNNNVSGSMPGLTQFIMLAPILAGFILRDRTPAYVIIAAGIALSTAYIARGYEAAFTDRSFFGVMKIGVTEDPRLGGQVNILMHGTTLHGSQPRNPAFACMPTLYYAPSTPLGQVMQGLQLRNEGRGVTVGVVGQGSGAMAGYKRAEDNMAFFEIDPMVDRLSRDPQWFTFISTCADGPVRTVLGDARLSMAHEKAGTYDYLVIDAFSSDAVPTHLLTVEAIAGYLKLLKPDGVLLLHLSNRNLDITRPAQAAAVALGVPYLHQLYAERPDTPDMAEASTEAIILSPTEAGLARFRSDPRWAVLPDTKVKPWTDDYVNLFGSLWRHFRGEG